MIAGLIPGVDIFSRPRIFDIYVEMSVNEAMADMHAATAANPKMDIEKVMEAAIDAKIPPLSPIRKRERETQRQIALLRKLMPKKDK